MELSKTLKVSRLTILRDIEKLKNLALIKRVGSDKSGRWNVFKEGKNLLNDIANDTVNDTVNKRQKRILSLIESNPQITVLDLASQIGVTRLTVIRDLDKLKKNNLVKRQGSDKTGTWVLV